MNACRFCGADVLWMRTHKDRWMPLDPEPNPDGNVVIDNGRVRVLSDDGRSKVQALGWVIYMAHFATCPNHPKSMPSRRKRKA